MICPECGSSLIVQGWDDVCECQQCGEEFYQEEAQDLTDEDIDDLIIFGDAEPGPDIVLDLPDLDEMDEQERNALRHLLDDLRGADRA